MTPLDQAVLILGVVGLLYVVGRVVMRRLSRRWAMRPRPTSPIYGQKDPRRAAGVRSNVRYLSSQIRRTRP